MSTTPTTAAGRALYDDKRVHNIAQRTKADDEHDREWAASIVAVEDEARATRKLLGRSALAYLNEADAALAAEKERVARLLSEHAAEKSLIFDDLGAILRALGLFDGARPISGHDVVQTVILPAIEALAASAEPRWPSGPDAERELAAALAKSSRCLIRDMYDCPDPQHYHGHEAAAILAALQEKRDPGE